MISCHKHLIRFLPALLLAGAGLVAAQPPAAVVELASVSEGQSSSVARLAGTVISTRDAQVAAELDGRLTWLARVGDTVRAGDPLASIDDYLLQLRERDDRSEIARLDADIAYHQRQIERLRSLVPVGDARSRMLELRLTPEDQRWLIGEAVTVELPDSLPEATLQVPRDALVLRDNEVFVYTVGEDDTARKVPVTTGAGRDSLIAIVGDLRAGDPVVVRGAERLREGQALKVVRHHIAATP